MGVVPAQHPVWVGLLSRISYNFVGVSYFMAQGKRYRQIMSISKWKVNFTNTCRGCSRIGDFMMYVWMSIQSWVILVRYLYHLYHFTDVCLGGCAHDRYCETFYCYPICDNFSRPPFIQENVINVAVSLHIKQSSDKGFTKPVFAVPIYSVIFVIMKILATDRIYSYFTHVTGIELPATWQIWTRYKIS